MGVYEERAPPTTGMHWQPPNSQERGSGLALGCQGGLGGSAGGPGAMDQARDLSPCLPASMGDAARPTTLPCSPPAAHHHHVSSHRTQLHQTTHCGTNNNNCYDGTTTPYESRDYGSPGGGTEFRNSSFEHSNDLNHQSLNTQQHNHHNHHHHHHHENQHHHNHQSQVHQHQQLTESQSAGSDDLHTIPKLEPPPTPPTQLEDVSGVVCAGCGLRISDRFYLQAVERRWHAACLQCSHCRQGLDGEVTCFSRDGNIYCKKDYYKMFGSLKRCARCQAAILSSELVMRARELVFHVRCFSCAICAVPLTKGDTFGMRNGVVLCRSDYEMGAEMHPSQSPPVPVYPPGPHYPGQSFPSPEFLHHQPHHHGVPTHPHHTMHPQHPHQLTHASPVPLQPSTPSGPEVGSPPKVPYFNGTAQAVGGAAGVPPPRQKGRPRKRKPKDLEAMTASLGFLLTKSSTRLGCCGSVRLLSSSRGTSRQNNPSRNTNVLHNMRLKHLNSEYIDMPFGRGPGTPGMPGSNSRTKRMRTSFKHHQLRTMKSYFSINHNPDAKDLKQLSQKTGLPKRVLQVWFQNARAKWRRMVLKQEGKSDKCGSVDGNSLNELELYGNSAGSGGPPMSPPFMLGGPHSPASLGSLDCA